MAQEPNLDKPPPAVTQNAQSAKRSSGGLAIVAIVGSLVLLVLLGGLVGFITIPGPGPLPPPVPVGPATRPLMSAGTVVHLAQIVAVSGEVPEGFDVGRGCATSVFADEMGLVSGPLELACGAGTLTFQSSGTASKLERAGASVVELIATGHTSDETRLELNTAEHELRVLSPAGGTIHLFVEHPSLEREIVTPLPGQTITPRLHRIATRTEAHESAPAYPRCELVIEPTRDGLISCRVSMRCAEQLVYGADNTGWNHCQIYEEVDAPLLVVDDSGTDADGDPRLRVRNDDTAELSETAVGRSEIAWWARYTLTPPALPEHATYAGRVGLGGATNALTLRFTGAGVIDADGAEALIEHDASAGELHIVANGHTLEGHWGPGLATIGGRDAEGKPFVLFRQ